MRRGRFSDERGTSTLEFVVVLPCLLIVMFGIVEISRAWFTLNMVTTAAREAARAGAVAPAASFPNPGTATARVNTILGTGTWSGGVTCSASPCVTDSQVNATITKTFSTVIPLLATLVPSLQSLTITHTSISRYE